MAEFIDEFAKTLAEGGEKALIERETEKIFQKSLKFNAQEFSAIFDESKSLQQEAGRWKLNGVSSEEIASKMRSGDLIELFEKMDVNVGDRLNLLEKQKTLREIISNCPELHLTELDEKFGKVAKNVEELNQNIEKLTEMNESLQKKVLERAEKAKWIKLPTALSLITAAALVGLISTIIGIMSDMKGCYLYRIINGKLEKYKIKSRSTNKNIPDDLMRSHAVQDYAVLRKPSNYLDNCTNLTLKIRQVFKNSESSSTDSPSKNELIKILGDKSNPSRDEIKLYIREKTKDLQDHFKRYPVIVSAPLDLLYEDEKVNCVACDPSAPIDSLNYTTRDGLATNETFHCIDHVSIYEAFKNFGEDTLNDIVDDFANLFDLKGLMLTVGKFLLLFVVLYIIGNFAIIYFTKTKHYERLEEEESEIQMKPLKAA
ncbi:uncharacterized LOC118072523 [Chelonus insularis]|uniref:uncharacterized LOC118072523 n=1 Tax=Chelonus insularis TaxID=460826 RepID=UPI001589A4DE|nr:uncharacterized LOC118072523 [Chelonus insularis]KAG8148307.1 putative per os infectivity factor pif-5 [Chelonus insularis]